MLSAFAFTPSVLANDIPLATLSVENIQVRAEWNMVGDSANHFSVEGGTLMLTADIEAGDTFIAIVEVRDKFSTLNPNYEDLATTVMITAVIRCGAECTEYLNANAPLISGFYAGLGRTVTVGTAFVLDGRQFFYLNLTLGNILNELYTPKVIIDDGKVFSIDNKYPSDNRYEYYANLTVGSDTVHGDKYNQPHGVIVLNHVCPTVYAVTATKGDVVNLIINASDVGKVKAYATVEGKEGVYKTHPASFFNGAYYIQFQGLQTSISNGFAPGTSYTIKYADHFLCENIGG